MCLETHIGIPYSFDFNQNLNMSTFCKTTNQMLLKAISLFCSFLWTDRRTHIHSEANLQLLVANKPRKLLVTASTEENTTSKAECFFLLSADRMKKHM
jgi:hypothetical protein